MYYIIHKDERVSFANPLSAEQYAYSMIMELDIDQVSIYNYADREYCLRIHRG